MKIAIRRIGNSRGVIIPAVILNQVGLEDQADVSVRDGTLVISPPKKNARAGWAEASKRVAAAGDDALLMPELPNADDADWQW
jgi:antitoxin MazE